MIKNIIWDFDGTLFNTYPIMTYAFKRALKDRGIEESEKNILDQMKISFSVAANHFTELYKLDNKFIEDYKYYERNSNLDKIVPFENAKEFCESFKHKGGRNFIFTHKGKEGTHKILRYHNMEELFAEIVTIDNGFKRKPDAEGFLYLANKYNMNKDNGLVVGDRDIEIIGAKNSGLKSCLYNTNEAHVAVEPDYTIDSLKDLEKIVF